MYTQCPECSIAFRVTADVLKQAAGKVRCGGCGSAFNALDYLSETKPARPRGAAAEAPLPELRPDPPEAGGPQTISAAQSAALLKTLDELAGSDIRIEDTGVEWRVLDEDEVGEAADDAIAVDVDIEDQPQIDEILEDSPTPVDQFLTDTPPEVDSPEIFDDASAAAGRTPVDELRFDDNTPLPDDFDLDEAPSPLPVPEPEPEPKPVAEPQADLDLSEPDEWTDILDEFEDLADELALEARAGPEDLSGPEPDAGMAPEADEEPLPEDDADEGESPLDMDSQFALQAEALGIDLSGTHAALDESEEPELTLDDDIDTLLQAGLDDDKDIEDLLEEEIVDEVDDAGTQLELIDDEDDDDAVDMSDDWEDSDEHFIPPLTEEEQTINMQIDQDLLAIAVEDENGFVSTMVLPEDAAVEKMTDDTDADAPGDDDEHEDDVLSSLADTSSGFETIIMEGDFVRSELDDEKLAADAAAAASLAGAAAAEREAERAARAGKVNYRMVAGIVVLALLLVGQFLHQSRDSLATIPAFNNVVGPMYRAIGQPLTPAWDITGWRFEATRGSTDADNQNLTIYSRIGNTSDKPLPYPLIGISLTDRFEETIGSRVLDPAEYLAHDLDPRKLVDPGNTFNAVITIATPSEAATGFKLNVCYRESGGNLRCAIDDFK